MEKISLKNFCDFCKNNAPLLVATALALFFCYGIKLCQYSFGIEFELIMVESSGWLKTFIIIGRPCLSLLMWLFNIRGYNPFIAFLGAFCLMWLFTISYAYIIALFCKNTGKNNALIPFALVFISSPIWAEQFYFVFQAREVALMVLLCPFTIYIMFKGFIDNKKGKIIFAFLSLIFMTSVYQSMVPFFCCGVFICFMLFLETSDYEQKFYRNLCLKIFAMFVCAMLVYAVIYKILIPSITMGNSAYLDDMNMWGHRSIKRNILNIFQFAYILTIGGLLGSIPQINSIIASHANSGMEAAEFIANMSNVFGNILLLPLALLFIIKSIDIARKKFTSDKKALYIIAAIGIPLSIMFLAILGGTKPSIRTIYVLPLAFAFMFFFLIKNYSKKFCIAVVCFALLTAAYQTQTTAQLLYSDQLRYNEDVRLAYEIRDKIVQVSLSNENLPVAIIGTYNIAEKFQANANFIKGEVIGSSFFFDPKVGVSTWRGLSFMRCLGINFNPPNGEQMEKAIYESTYMPSYPNPEFVKELPDVIVVKLSDIKNE